MLDYGAIFMCVLELVYVFCLHFFYCEFGNQLESKFDEINEALYESDWTSYPAEVQRMMPVILLVSQQPVQLFAYGNYPCSRETFKKVIRKMFMVRLTHQQIFPRMKRKTTKKIATVKQNKKHTFSMNLFSWEIVAFRSEFPCDFPNVKATIDEMLNDFVDKVSTPSADNYVVQ